MTAREVRRADFLMTLAYATDLATGHSRDFALRSRVLGMRFAVVAKLDQETSRSIYHQALLRYIGCNADSCIICAKTLVTNVGWHLSGIPIASMPDLSFCLLTRCGFACPRFRRTATLTTFRLDRRAAADCLWPRAT